MALADSPTIADGPRIEDGLVPVASGFDPKPIPPGRRRSNGNRLRWGIEWAVIVVAAISVAVLVRTTVVQAFYIPSPSMVPTLKVHDRLLVDKVTFHARDIRRGDIVVFKRPPALKQKDINDLIKRVIGLPGDHVEGRGGQVYVNGAALAEPYLPKTIQTAPFDEVIVPIDAYFVMGDNRPESYDSRFWGTVSRKLIVGRAMIRIWPIGRFGRF